MTKHRHREFNAYKLEQLKDQKLALAYLNEALLDKDQRVFLLALKDVITAQGFDMEALIKVTGLGRQSLGRILSAKGDPTLSSIRLILHVVGFKLTIQPATHK